MSPLAALQEARLNGPPRVGIVSIDVLRALAALAVVAFHLHLLFGTSGSRVVDALADHGWLGVSLFFVISGFCIHLPYARAERIEPREYLVRRFVRIWPPYAAAILVGIVAAYLHGPVALRTLAFMVGHAAFLLVGETPIRHENVVLWSIVVEVQLYLFYLAIRCWSPRGMTLWRWTIAFVAFGLAYHVIVAVAPLPAFFARVMNPRFFAPARMGEWLCGALVADAFVRGSAIRRPIALCVGGAGLVLATRAATIASAIDRYALESLDAIGFALLVAGVVSRERQRTAVASPLTRAFAAIGRRCYSLYLFHLPTLHWTTAALATTFATRAPLIALALAMTFAVAEVAYRLIERPSHRLARRLGRACRAEASAAALIS